MQNEKDNERQNALVNNALHKPRMNVFKNDAFTNFVHKKTERITTALYLITNLLPQEEPLKWKLRERGIALMSHVLCFGTGNSEPDMHPDVSIVPLIIELVSLLEVSYVSRAISEMNFVVLKREYEQVIDLFEKAKTRRKETGREGYVIPKNFFDLPYESSLVELLEEDDNMTDNNGNKKTSVVSRPSETREAVRQGRNSEFSIGVVPLPIHTQRSGTSRNPRSKSRREGIISILRQQGKLNIKDITKVVRGCSEKTVQRELLSLVKEGIVMKEGERRWSMYALVA